LQEGVPRTSQGLGFRAPGKNRAPGLENAPLDIWVVGKMSPWPNIDENASAGFVFPSCPATNQTEQTCELDLRFYRLYILPWRRGQGREVGREGVQVERGREGEQGRVGRVRARGDRWRNRSMFKAGTGKAGEDRERGAEGSKAGSYHLAVESGVGGREGE